MVGAGPQDAVPRSDRKVGAGEEKSVSCTGQGSGRGLAGSQTPAPRPLATETREVPPRTGWATPELGPDGCAGSRVGDSPDARVLGTAWPSATACVRGTPSVPEVRGSGEQHQCRRTAFVLILVWLF